ncbi:hypothetical protein ACFQ0M_48000 [Kitasatospora aburaviensis]
MAGSYEEQQDRLREAVQVLFLPNQESAAEAAWVCVEATFPDHVIVSVARPEPGETFTYSVPYETTGDGVTLGAPQRVELAVVAVETDAPGDTEEEEEVEPEEAAEARFLRPAAGRLADATSAIAVADVEPEQLEDLRPAVERLLRTLARKGCRWAAPATIRTVTSTTSGACTTTLMTTSPTRPVRRAARTVRARPRHPTPAVPRKRARKARTGRRGPRRSVARCDRGGR